MGRKYDLFEKFPDGTLTWRNAVFGQEEAIRKLREVAAKTENECYLMDTPTQTVVAKMNSAST
jgi:hypothetical protein